MRDVDEHFQRQHAGPKASDASNSLQQGRISCIEVAVAAAFDEGIPALRAGLKAWLRLLPCGGCRCPAEKCGMVTEFDATCFDLIPGERIVCA
ncbi:hypothetical protein [Variovorax sp. UC74_104]|uniref:hypothetical protein n=1 Tax=Variovorax sp. UC74_104 TaxID=3374555 RepID=UPI0037568A81